MTERAPLCAQFDACHPLTDQGGYGIQCSGFAPWRHIGRPIIDPLDLTRRDMGQHQVDGPAIMLLALAFRPFVHDRREASPETVRHLMPMIAPPAVLHGTVSSKANLLRTFNSLITEFQRCGARGVDKALRQIGRRRELRGNQKRGNGDIDVDVPDLPPPPRRGEPGKASVLPGETAGTVARSSSSAGMS